jgi:ParB family chromosome partitioning protein
LLTLTDLQAKLAEIDENIERTPLTVLEYSQQLNERKSIYEGLHPETKPGKSQAAGMNRKLGHDVSDKMSLTFTADTAKKLNKTMRSVQRDLAIARSIDDSVQRVIAGMARPPSPPVASGCVGMARYVFWDADFARPVSSPVSSLWIH